MHAMRICLVTDDRMCITPEGTYYSNTGYDWRAFGDLFGPSLKGIRVMARVTPMDAPPPGWAPHEMDERTAIVGLPWFDKYRALLRLPRAVVLLFKELRRADLAWLVVPNVYPSVAYPVARVLRRPVLAWCVGDVSETALLVYDELPMRLAYRLYARVTRGIVRHAEVGVVASRTLASKYQQSGRDVIVAYRALRDPRYLACERKRAPGRTVVYLGRLSPEKGVGTLIDSFARVTHEVPGARLLIAGDGAQREELELAVKSNKIEDVVDFLGWVPHGPQLKELLASSDVLCLPSYTEGMPGALLEGMSAGLPVVGTTAGDIPAVVGLHDAGRTVAPRDGGALAQALIDVLNDPDHYRTMSEAARQTADELGFERETGKVASAAVAAVTARSRA